VKKKTGSSIILQTLYGICTSQIQSEYKHKNAILFQNTELYTSY